MPTKTKKTTAGLFMHILCISAFRCSKNGSKVLFCWGLLGVERVKGIEPSSQAWEARILPLDHTRFR